MSSELGNRDASGGAFPDVVLTLVEAAWASGLARGELQRLIRARELSVRRVVREGRVVSVVSLKELERVHRAHASAEDERREASDRLRERLARMEGELAASAKVERALQRYADRLEEKSNGRILQLEAGLAEARKREMTLARALGRAEARLAQRSRSAPLRGAAPVPELELH